MNLIDTHCHLDFPDFDKDREAVIDRAKKAGIVRIVNVASSLEGCRKTSELAKKFDFIYGTVGIHPHYADSVDDKLISSLYEMAQHKKTVAIGEVGLDYYRNISSRENQKAAFLKFINLSKELDLPLIVHSRDALGDVLDILKAQLKSKGRGVVHCFFGRGEDINKILNLGFYISFTCNLTFKNAGTLREIAKLIPMEQLLLETDAPFLAPQFFRGKRNEPSYITHLLEALSQIKDLPKEKIAEVTTRNANKLFKLGLEV